MMKFDIDQKLAFDEFVMSVFDRPFKIHVPYALCRWPSPSFHGDAQMGLQTSTIFTNRST